MDDDLPPRESKLQVVKDIAMTIWIVLWPIALFFSVFVLIAYLMFASFYGLI